MRESVTGLDALARVKDEHFFEEVDGCEVSLLVGLVMRRGSGFG